MEAAQRQGDESLVWDGRRRNRGLGGFSRLESLGDEEEIELLFVVGVQCNVLFVCFCLDIDMVIIYLLVGIILKDFLEEDKKAIFRVISEENSFLNNFVMIFIYVFMNGRQRFKSFILYEGFF